MKRLTKRMLAVLLIAAVFVVSVNGDLGTVQAAETVQFVDVVQDDAPLRKGPTKFEDAIAHTHAGRVLRVVGKTYNKYHNLWYRVSWENEPGDGNTAYIYSGNVEKHSHAYSCLDVDGIQYNYCECGSVYVEETSYVRVSQADTLVLGASSLAGATSLADGPLPVGEMIGAILIAGAFCVKLSGAIPDSLTAISTNTDFMEYVQKNKNVCTSTNFRMVARTGGTLTVIGNSCLSVPEAYIYARFCGGDVWTPDTTGAAALECAALNGEFFGPEVDKNKPGYYYHYHMGTDHKDVVGGHIFYGKGQFNQCVPAGS